MQPVNIRLFFNVKKRRIPLKRENKQVSILIFFSLHFFACPKNCVAISEAKRNKNDELNEAKKVHRESQPKAFVCRTNLPLSCHETFGSHL